jgi:hypothetical protein
MCDAFVPCSKGFLLWECMMALGVFMTGISAVLYIQSLITAQEQSTRAYMKAIMFARSCAESLRYTGCKRALLEADSTLRLTVDEDTWVSTLLPEHQKYSMKTFSIKVFWHILGKSYTYCLTYAMPDAL